MNSVDDWVCAEFANLAQVLYEYDENLRLEMIPPNLQQELIDKSKVFRVIDIRTNSVVMTFDSLTNPTDILTQIFNRDMKHGSVVARMDNRNKAAELLNLSRELDKKEAAKDLAAFVIKNTKSRWTHEGRIRDDEFRDLGPIRKVIN